MSSGSPSQGVGSTSCFQGRCERALTNSCAISRGRHPFPAAVFALEHQPCLQEKIQQSTVIECGDCKEKVSVFEMLPEEGSCFSLQLHVAFLAKEFEPSSFSGQVFGWQQQF